MIQASQLKSDCFAAGGAASGIAHDQRGEEQRVLPDSPYLRAEATSTSQGNYKELIESQPKRKISVKQAG